MKLCLPDIKHNQAGFGALVDLYAKAKDVSFRVIEIDMKETTWFDADMCAPYGAILYQLGSRVNEIKLTNIRYDIEKILEKNSFLSHYEHKKIPDSWGTTISYRRFDLKDESYFAEYIENEFIQRPEVPLMSINLKKMFQKSICEIFSNAVLHSLTVLGVFSCGQLFPKRDRLNFSVADLGIGMRQNISNFQKTILSPEDAIIWATSNRNTTKQGNVPGGLGLKLLREFIDMNGGCIQIVSDAGYWRRENKEVNTSRLYHPFPATVINVEINTADLASYILATELTTEDIF